MIKGFNCPIKGRVNFKECQSHALEMLGMPECGFDLYTLKEMEAALTETNPELDAIFASGSEVYRASTLSGPCPRSAVLDKYFPAEYLSPQSQYYLTRGSWWHLVKEKWSANQEGVTNEVRLSAVVKLEIPETEKSSPTKRSVSVTVTGKFDSLQEWAVFFTNGTAPKSQTQSEEQAKEENRATVAKVWRTLTDYKTTEWLPDKAKPEHELQLNIYVFLLAANGYDIPDELRVEYIGMKTQVIRVAELWEVDHTLEQIRQKLLPIVESSQAIEQKIQEEFGGDKNAFADCFTPQDPEIESLLPTRLNPLDKKNGGWKCNGYCPHTTNCWPKGVPQQTGATTYRRHH